MAAKKKELHKKPSNEELEKGMDEALKKLDEGGDKTSEDQEPEDDQKPEDDTPAEKDEGEDDGEGAEEEEPQPDYKEKFVQSAKEAQVLHARQKKMTDAVDEAAQIQEPTEDELKVEYPEWEMMSESEQRLAKKTLVADRRFEAINKANQEMKNISNWNEKVAKFLDDPKNLADNPELEGKQEEFLLFAVKPTRRGIDFEDLVSSFLYNAGKSMTKKKGKMFEAGSGGPPSPAKPKSDKVSLEEARVLRDTDYKKYISLLKANKIANE